VWPDKSPGRVLAIAAAEAFAWDAVLVLVDLAVACLHRGHSLSAGLEGGTALCQGSPGTQKQKPKAGESENGRGLYGNHIY
jgi:hypothetical protein